MTARAAARVGAAIALVRPLNLAGIAAASWVGGRIAGAEFDPLRAAVPVFIAAFGYVHNDLADRAADRVNRPGRPLPSGRVGAALARAFSLASLVAAWALVAVSHPSIADLAVAGAATAALVLYSPWLKDRGAWGPASIAALSGLALLWGALPGAFSARGLLPALLAASVQFARECVKQLEDAAGDLAAGRGTWVARSGPSPATRAAKLAIIASLLLLPLPVTTGVVAPRYLLAAAPASGIPLLAAYAALAAPHARYGRVSAAIKIALFAGIGALACGS